MKTKLVVTQEYSSASTSINSIKVPAIFHKIHWIAGTTNLDYGGGKYDTATEYLQAQQVQNYIYDPYNRSHDHNVDVIQTAPYDTATVSNVMNVIKESEIRMSIIQEVLNLLKPNGLLYISVYEGNKTGVGASSRNGCWQENRKITSYVKEFKQFEPTLKKHMIIIQKQGSQERR